MWHKVYYLKKENDIWTVVEPFDCGEKELLKEARKKKTIHPFVLEKECGKNKKLLLVYYPIEEIVRRINRIKTKKGRPSKKLSVKNLKKPLNLVVDKKNNKYVLISGKKSLLTVADIPENQAKIKLLGLLVEYSKA